MIRPRPSAFSHYRAKSIYLQNLKPHLHPKNQTINTNKFAPNSKIQKRNCSTYSQKDPNNDPSFWLLVAAGCCILYNFGSPPKKMN